MMILLPKNEAIEYLRTKLYEREYTKGARLYRAYRDWNDAYSLVMSRVSWFSRRRLYRQVERARDAYYNYREPFEKALNEADLLPDGALIEVPKDD